jgi:hypothetical protein
MSHACVLALLLIASNSDSEENLVEAISEFGQGHLERALSLLEQAEQQTTEPKMLAKIHRQRGIIFDVELRRLESIVAFNTALWLDPDLELSETEHRGQVALLFACAKKLFEAGEREVSIRTRYGTELERSEWTCPANAKSEVPPAEIAPPPPSSAITAAPEAEADGIGVPFWIATGTAIAAAGIGAGLGGAALSKANDGDAATDPRGVAIGATVSLSVAGAAAVTALVLLMIDLI